MKTKSLIEYQDEIKANLEVVRSEIKKVKTENRKST